MSSKPGIKKRRAPLPEDVYPNIKENVVNEKVRSHELFVTSNGTQPRTLPLGSPVVEGSNPQDQISPFTRYSWASPLSDSGISKTKRRSVDHIKSLSDNEALDVQDLSDQVKAFDKSGSRNGRKRHSSEDLKRLRSTSSKSSLLSLNLSEKSISLNSVSSSTDYVDSQMVDQEGIVTLTVHVRKFSDALSKLRNAFSGSGSDTESDECTDNDTNASVEMQVKAHKCLGEVLSNLKEVINQYPSLNSKEILEAAGQLISKVKSHNYDESNISDDFYQSIDQLALVFSSSISDFLMGDQEVTSKTGDDGEDCVDEYAEDGDDEDLSEGDMLDESLKLTKQEHLNDVLRDQETDIIQVLHGMESGVDFCLQWTKCWSKYVKDIANYVEKRAQLEAEYTKQLTKLAQTTRNSIAEESYLPFQSTFFTALDQDLDYSQRCQQTLAAISGSKFMSPLMQRRTVHDRARKDMKDEWTKMCKQLHESVNSVKTTKAMYYKRKQELEKLNTKQGDVKEAKDSVFGTNKGKKEDELKAKVEEAKQFYSSAVEVANQTQTDSEKTKEWIVAQTKQLVNECDRTFRSVTRKYFDMMHDLAVPTPIHFKTLAESCQGYEPGKQFEEFVRFQQSTARSISRPVFQFEQYSNSSRSSGGPLAQELENTTKLLGSPLRTWASSQQFSDNECGGSPTPSPSASPQSSKKSTNGRPNFQPPPSTDDDSEGETKGSSKTRPFRQRRRPKTPASLNKVTLSKSAETHMFHKIRSPGKCSECDSYVFNGVECAQCGLSCHKKCLENICTDCHHSRRKTTPLKRMRTFGVYFSQDGTVPVLVTKCINEINRRGLRVKGIYRVSGVKSKMEGLCQEFETNADSVDLSTQPPHLIASVLKLYIRQMPEPLLTTKLYHELIQLAKETPHLTPLSLDEYHDENDANDFRRLLERLKEILDKLPKSNYLTTSLLVKHLHKVAKEEEFNQMSTQNLAIVFGPTILRQESYCSENSTTSLSSLVDMPHQTRIVALLIVNPQLLKDEYEDSKVEATNGSDVENDILPLPDTPVETFVSPKVDEAVMPDLYGAKSDRVRGEGLSPMDKLQSYPTEEYARVDRVTSKTNERIDVKGEATVFDDNEMSLPGSLEQQNKYLESGPEDEDLSDRETDLVERESSVNQPLETWNDLINVEKTYKDRISTSSHEETTDYQEKKPFSVSSSEVQASYSNAVSSDRSRNEQGEDLSVPRTRSTVFGVDKKNVQPDVSMLGKRNMPLTNIFFDGTSKLDDTETPHSGYSSKDDVTNVAATDIDTEKTEHPGTPVKELDAQTNSEADLLASTTASDTSVKIETTEESEVLSKEPSSALTAIKSQSSVRQRAKTSTERQRGEDSASGDELNVLGVSSGRKRSSTFDNNRRKRPGARPEGDEKRVHSTRPRHHRVSVKDKIMELEQRGGRDATKTLSLPLTIRDSIQTAAATSGENGTENNTVEADNDTVDVKPKEVCASRDSTPIRPKEPLSRIRPKGTHKDLLIDTPWNASSSRQTSNEKFCALKMDINLESQWTPSSDSSSEDTPCPGQEQTDNRTYRLNPWSGRGLTPRDSNQAPEFV